MIWEESEGRFVRHAQKKVVKHLEEICLQSTDPAVVERNKFAAEKRLDGQNNERSSVDPSNPSAASKKKRTVIEYLLRIRNADMLHWASQASMGFGSGHHSPEMRMNEVGSS